MRLVVEVTRARQHAHSRSHRKQPNAITKRGRRRRCKWLTDERGYTGAGRKSLFIVALRIALSFPTHNLWCLATHPRLWCAGGPAACRVHVLPTALRCVDSDGGGAHASVLWEIRWEHLLLVQQCGSRLRLLALAAHNLEPDAMSSATTGTRDVELHSDDDAARLHEIVRLAGLNAKGSALPLAPRWPLVRTTLLASPPSSTSSEPLE